MKKYDDAFLEWEKGYLLAALNEADNSVVKAAKLMGVHRSVVYKMATRTGVTIRGEGRSHNVRTWNRGNKAWQELGRVQS